MREKLASPRFDTQLALVFERYLLAFGGKISKFHGTKRCEIMDTKSGGWSQLVPMPYFAVNTSAVTCNKRQVYLLPGHNRETNINDSLVIAFLDCAPLDRGLDALSTLVWLKLIVKDPDFVSACPTAGVQLEGTPEKIVIFGGQTKQTFILDTKTDVDKVNGTATVKLIPSQLVHNGKFAYQSDFVVKTFENFHYAIDGTFKYLHMFKEQSLEWEGQTLAALGLNINTAAE